MKEYLRELRWYLWAAAILPLLHDALRALPALILMLHSTAFYIIIVLAFAALFVLSGRRAAQAGYPLSKACFAGPAALVVSNLIVGIPLRYATLGGYIQAGKHPAWLGWLLLPIGAILGFLVLFPVALGLAALGAHLFNRGKI